MSASCACVLRWSKSTSVSVSERQTVEMYCLVADRSQGADMPRLPTPLSQHQLPGTHGGLPLSGQEVADIPASQHWQDPAKPDAHVAAKGVAEMRLTDAADEETTMCLREQLIHSRCTESRCAVTLKTTAV